MSHQKERAFVVYSVSFWGHEIVLPDTYKFSWHDPSQLVSVLRGFTPERDREGERSLLIYTRWFILARRNCFTLVASELEWHDPSQPASVFCGSHQGESEFVAYTLNYLGETKLLYPSHIRTCGARTTQSLCFPGSWVTSQPHRGRLTQSSGMGFAAMVKVE